MSSSSANAVGYRSWSRCGGGSGRVANWSGFNIAGMVVGFVFFWPVGLVMLFWILSGRNVQDLPGAVREQWAHLFSKNGSNDGPTDNVVFNDYQQTQYDRIREIKEEITKSASRFAEFRSDARRRADQEEFNRFMASGPGSAKSTDQ